MLVNFFFSNHPNLDKPEKQLSFPGSAWERMPRGYASSWRRLINDYMELT